MQQMDLTVLPPLFYNNIVAALKLQYYARIRNIQEDQHRCRKVNS